MTDLEGLLIVVAVILMAIAVWLHATDESGRK